ncbi:MAG: hypothetical protein IJ746_03480 [Ruminococcus sp.]|nr:hypothetical protein [Ruminococcus sp.]
MNRGNAQTFLTRKIWCKIRYYQQMHGISNIQLAAVLMIKPRTLTIYDMNARNVTLGQLESFLNTYSITLKQLMED